MISEFDGRKWQLVAEQIALHTAGLSPSWTVQSAEPIRFVFARAVFVTSAALGTRLVKWFWASPTSGIFQLVGPSGIAPSTAVVITWLPEIHYASPDPAYINAQLPSGDYPDTPQFGIAVDNIAAGDQFSSVFVRYWQRLAE